MSKVILKEFGKTKPRAIVLDDEDRVRLTMASELQSEGFEVIECADLAKFETEWAPGMFDLIVADWDLSQLVHGDEVLRAIRERDWDVPFILVSGRLNEDDKKSEVFGSMLSQGSCDFVERGDDAIARICEKAFQLLEKRDLALLRLILRFRSGAIRDLKIQSSSGPVGGKEILAELVRDPASSHDGEGPLADRIASELSKNFR